MLRTILGCLLSGAAAFAGPLISKQPANPAPVGLGAPLTVNPTFTKITTGPGEPKPAPDHAFGGAWWDFDNDGFLDVTFVCGGLHGAAREAFYHNNQDGTFTRVTNVISTTLNSHGPSLVADFDNDGNVDFLVLEYYSKTNYLYRNDGGGRFTPLTGRELGAALNDLDISTDAAWVDYDRDGFLDLFRANTYFAADNDCLYRNDGEGRFIKLTTNEVGQIVNDHAATQSCAWADYDNDGWPDLWIQISNGNVLYHNDHGFFHRVTNGFPTGLSFNSPVWGDYDNDGFLDVFDATGYLFRNLGGLAFTNVTASARIPKIRGGIAARWGDYDNDGFLDLYVTANAGQPSLLLRNNGNGTFTSVDVGSPTHDNTDSLRWYPDWADYDNDGFLDLVVGMEEVANLFYHNNGNRNHWLKIKLTGLASNRSAIGAKVRAWATIRGGELWQMREISSGSRSGGTPGSVAHFGLGEATQVDVLRIEWPSGLVQELRDVAADQSLTVTEHQDGVTVAPNLTAAKSADGAVQLMLTGPANLLYVLEASTNLVKWTKIAVGTNATGAVAFVDRRATNYGSRFYRAFAP